MQAPRADQAGPKPRAISASIQNERRPNGGAFRFESDSDRKRPAGTDKTGRALPLFSGELESENMREGLLGTSPLKGIALFTALLYNTLINQ